MTADVELLPCPFCGSAEPIVAEPPEILPLSFQIICSGSGCNALVESRTLARAKLMWNRRANVAHATAAKDAEIETLRAEVERLKALVRSVGYETLDRAEQAEARAERLAEALRELRNHTSVNSDQIALIDAALEQESNDA